MANQKIRPLEDRVVVEPLEAEEKTAGGILLPDAAREHLAQILTELDEHLARIIRPPIRRIPMS